MSRPNCPDHDYMGQLEWWSKEHGYHLRCKEGGFLEDGTAWECGHIGPAITKGQYKAHWDSADERDDRAPR